MEKLFVQFFYHNANAITYLLESCSSSRTITLVRKSIYHVNQQTPTAQTLSYKKSILLRWVFRKTAQKHWRGKGTRGTAESSRASYSSYTHTYTFRTFCIYIYAIESDVDTKEWLNSVMAPFTSILCLFPLILPKLPPTPPSLTPPYPIKHCTGKI